LDRLRVEFDRPGCLGTEPSTKSMATMLLAWVIHGNDPWGSTTESSCGAEGPGSGGRSAAGRVSDRLSGSSSPDRALRRLSPAIRRPDLFHPAPREGGRFHRSRPSHT